MQKSLNYQPQIDGLRAFAILSVILFHAGFSFIPGGFVGVDIFFVISGFLITGILIKDYLNDEFSFVYFYQRRIRRIIPALSVVLFFILGINYFYLSPIEYKNLAKSVFASILFLGNVTAYQQTDYFDSASEFKPAIHLWSLGVEEQFYLIAPIFFIMLLRRKRIAWLALGLSMLALISFFYSEYLLDTNPRMSYYSIFSRAWELMIGSLFAILVYQVQVRQINVPTKIASALSWLGFVAVLFSFIYISPAKDFPGIWALIPTLGAGLYLAFSKYSRSSFLYKIMTSPLLVWVGLISFSAYLWHQPLFALFRFINPNELELGGRIALIMVVFFLSFLTYQFVEKPFRSQERIPNKILFTVLMPSAVIIISSTLFIYSQSGLPGRFMNLPPESVTPFKYNESDICKFKTLEDNPQISSCSFGNPLGRSLVFLYGDSHASAILGGLDEEFKKSDKRGIRVKIEGCPHFIPGMIAGEVNLSKLEALRRCEESFNSLLAYFRAQKATVIVNVRWPARFSPIPGEYSDFAFNNQQGGIEYKPNIQNMAINSSGEWDVSGMAKKAALSNFLTLLSFSADQLIVVDPTPEPGWDLPKYNFSRYHQNGAVDREVSIDKKLFDLRQNFTKQTLDDLKLTNLLRVSPEKHMCDSYKDICYIQRDFNALFYDTNHLTYLGSKPIVKDIISILDNRETK
jgi:peptidoglycan/LPS O-acetylase OafA/YrhL